MIVGLLPVRAPVSLVLAGVSVEHNHAVIAVAVGDIDLVGLRVHRHIRGASEILGVVAVVLRTLMADLQQKLALLRELQNLRIAPAVARKPDIVLVVDENAVLRLGPFISLALTTP